MALADGTRAAASLVRLFFSVLPSPVVQVQAVQTSIAARLSRLGAFNVGAACGVLSFLHLRSQYVSAATQSLRQFGPPPPPRTPLPVLLALLASPRSVTRTTRSIALAS